MSTITLTKDTFTDTAQQEGIVLMDFWASWCGPCRAFGPVFEQAAAANPDITFAKIDTEDQVEIASAMRVQSIPTLMIFRDGIMIYNQAGALPRAALDDLIGQARALDMDEVRKSLADSTS